MKRGIVAGAIVALAIGLASNAQAEGFGCQVGFGLGESIANTEITAAGGLLDVNGIGSHSSRPDVGVRGECGIRASSFYFGGFGEYDWQNVQFQTSIGPTSISAALGDSYMLGGRVGLIVGSAMPYVGVAYSHSDLNWSSNLGKGLPSSVTGPTALAGIEFPLTSIPQLSLALETRWTHYDSVNIGTSGAAMQTDDLSGMVRLNYNFGAGAPATASASHSSLK